MTSNNYQQSGSSLIPGRYLLCTDRKLGRLWPPLTMYRATVGRLPTIDGQDPRGFLSAIYYVLIGGRYVYGRYSLCTDRWLGCL